METATKTRQICQLKKAAWGILWGIILGGRRMDFIKRLFCHGSTAPYAPDQTVIIPPRRYSSADWKSMQLKKSKRKLGRSWVLHKKYDAKDNPAHLHRGSLLLLPIKNKAVAEGRII